MGVTYYMNKVVLIGRLVANPECRFAQGSEPMAIAKYTLAVERKVQKGAEQKADFIRCVAFGRMGEVADRYLRKGMKVAVVGRIQTGSYKDKEGRTIYTTDVIVEEQEFLEKKKEDSEPMLQVGSDGFMDVSAIQEELPFK